ncbi:hypothetical protein IWX49DRAFT_594697 [Phyllosticta citricarpa]|uniref:Uncharacterized protein n=2 Tax=Phyllosticta TaxID=121621 RepID=A0ABR1LMT2_9PEZI
MEVVVNNGYLKGLPDSSASSDYDWVSYLAYDEEIPGSDKHGPHRSLAAPMSQQRSQTILTRIQEPAAKPAAPTAAAAPSKTIKPKAPTSPASNYTTERPNDPSPSSPPPPPRRTKQTFCIAAAADVVVAACNLAMVHSSNSAVELPNTANNFSIVVMLTATLKVIGEIEADPDWGSRDFQMMRDDAREAFGINKESTLQNRRVRCEHYLGV